MVASDHIGFSRSSVPLVDDFAYSFDLLTEITEGLITQLGSDRFAAYIRHHGAPIGLRIASAQPERIAGIITLGGNA